MTPEERDRKNAAFRREVADRMEAEMRKAKLLAIRRLGLHWQPVAKVTVVPAERRPTGPDDPPPAIIAVAYRVVYWSMGQRQERWLREGGDGTILCGERYEDVLADLLGQLHPTKTLTTHRGETFRCKLYDHYWSALETYEPEDAGGLARRREARERGRAGREEEAFRRDNPLLAFMEGKGDE